MSSECLRGGGVSRNQVLDVFVGHFGQTLTIDAFALKKTENSSNTKLQVESEHNNNNSVQNK